MGLDVESLDRREPDIAILEGADRDLPVMPAAAVAEPAKTATEELAPVDPELREQRRIVIYVNQRPRSAVTGIELLSPSNKKLGAVTRDRYLEKRASALHGGLQWVEIDLLRGGRRPELPVQVPPGADYLAYVAQASSAGWKHSIYSWGLSERLPNLPVPLLGEDLAAIDLAASFQQAYDRIAGDDEADYASPPPPPPLRSELQHWLDRRLREAGFRR